MCLFLKNVEDSQILHIALGRPGIPSNVENPPAFSVEKHLTSLEWNRAPKKLWVFVRSPKEELIPCLRQIYIYISPTHQSALLRR